MKPVLIASIIGFLIVAPAAAFTALFFGLVTPDDTLI